MQWMYVWGSFVGGDLCGEAAVKKIFRLHNEMVRQYRPVEPLLHNETAGDFRWLC